MNKSWVGWNSLYTLKGAFTRNVCVFLYFYHPVLETLQISKWKDFILSKPFKHFDSSHFSPPLATKMRQHDVDVLTLFTMRKINPSIRNVTYFALICYNNLLWQFVDLRQWQLNWQWFRCHNFLWLVSGSGWRKRKPFPLDRSTVVKCWVWHIYHVHGKTLKIFFSKTAVSRSN